MDKIAKIKKKMVGKGNIKGTYEEKEIGIVGVDSGQILICDPCYISSEWEEEDFDIGTEFIIFPDGTKEEIVRASPRWFELIDRINSKELKLIENSKKTAKSNFSYNACCQAYCSDEGYGQLNYKMGHAGVGVVTQSGYGDGCYPVIAKIEKETGRVKEIRVEFF